MKHIIRGIERLSNERRRSGSFDRGSGDWDAGASAGPLDQELCLQLVSDLHGAASEVTVARLSQAAAASNLSCDANRAIIVRAGAVVPLVELVRVAGPSSKDARCELLHLRLRAGADAVLSSAGVSLNLPPRAERPCWTCCWPLQKTWGTDPCTASLHSSVWSRL